MEPTRPHTQEGDEVRGRLERVGHDTAVLQGDRGGRAAVDIADECRPAQRAVAVTADDVGVGGEHVQVLPGVVGGPEDRRPAAGRWCGSQAYRGAATRPCPPMPAKAQRLTWN